MGFLEEVTSLAVDWMVSGQLASYCVFISEAEKVTSALSYNNLDWQMSSSLKGLTQILDQKWNCK